LENGLPKPPEHYSDDAAALWAHITASKPMDWWDAGTLPLLDAYVKTCLEHRRISDLVERHAIECDEDVASYEKLHKIQDRLASQLARLATKMRLSQQSKYGARGADSASQGGGKRPWES
jgi:hypothetical protein